jgi:hypothetical protein
MKLTQNARRERIACETYGNALDGELDDNFKPVVVSYDCLKLGDALAEKLGFTILLVDIQHIYDQVMFWIEWHEGADRFVEFTWPFKRVDVWRDVELDPKIHHEACRRVAALDKGEPV